MAYDPKAWWPSKLVDYRHCLRYGKLKHVDGVIPTKEGVDTAFGTGIHLGIHEILTAPAGLTGDEITDRSIELFQLYWDTCKHLKQDYRYGWKELGEMAPVFLGKFRRLHSKKFRPVHMEERLFGMLGAYHIEGTPDFLGYYEDEPAGVDFKTSSRAYAKEAIHSHDQIDFYCHLSAQQLGFVPKKKVLYVFVKETVSIQVLQKCLTEVNLCETLENVKAEIADYATRKTFPKNCSSCVSGPIVCDGFKLCFPEGVTDGEK